MATRRDYYDPITGRWIGQRTLLARVAAYSVQAERARERRRYAEADAYDAAVQSFDVQSELLAPPPRRERARVVAPVGVQLPPALRGYYHKARRLVREWQLDESDVGYEWELGDDYRGKRRRR